MSKSKTTWRQLFSYWAASVILGFGFSLGALGAFGWLKFIGGLIWR
ncbi:MAG: hypothetical protein [Bacteriophage sp.]|nr:MAG: hypothetical protein [Bacteriophage sp.]